MKHLLQTGSLAGAILLAAMAAPRAEGGHALYGVAPGMSQAEAMAALGGVARCKVEKQTLDEALLPSGTYELSTLCTLADGRGVLALRSTSSLIGERIAEIEFRFHSPEAPETLAGKLAREHGVASAAAEHVGGEWLWHLSDHVDLTLFVYPRGDARAVVMSDTTLQRQDALARSANTIAAVTGALGGRTGRGG